MKIYFIVSELLNNINKHSKAKRAKLTLKQQNNQLHIQVKDNGIGFEISPHKTIDGFGLNQIKARINTMKGKFKIDSVPKEGTTVKISVPIEFKI